MYYSAEEYPAYFEEYHGDVDEDGRADNPLPHLIHRPFIISQSLHVEVGFGDSFQLPCKVDQLPGRELL